MPSRIFANCPGPKGLTCPHLCAETETFLPELTVLTVPHILRRLRSATEYLAGILNSPVPDLALLPISFSSRCWTRSSSALRLDIPCFPIAIEQQLRLHVWPSQHQRNRISKARAQWDPSKLKRSHTHAG